MAKQIVLTRHAFEQAFARGIDIEEIHDVVRDGVVIAEYPEDRPFASRLLLGFAGDRPLHVVAANDEEGSITYVITAYEPDAQSWDESFNRRRRG